MSPFSVRRRDGAERTALRLGRLLAALGAALVALVLTAGTALAATTTQVASGLTNPLGILQLAGGDGASHVWVSDHLNGVCRLDPATGGGLVENQNSCVLFIGKAALKPGQLSYDQATSKIYVPDLSSKSLGVIPNAATANGVKASAVVGPIAAPTALAADPAHQALYVGNANTLYTFDAGPTSTGATAVVANGFSFTTAISATTSTATGAFPLLVGDDSSGGTMDQTGRLFSVTL